MEIRLLREVEKNKSVLYKTRAAAFASGGFSEMNGAPSTNGSTKPKDAQNDPRKFLQDELARDGEQSSGRSGQELSPEQLQLFAEENQDMLKQYEDTLDQVR